MAKRWLRWGLIAVAGVNAIAAAAAYTMTHYRGLGEFGLGSPKPVNAKVPADMGLNYATQKIPLSSKAWIETWQIPAPQTESNGTVLLFPGSGGTKGNQLLPPAKAFHALNYDALLVDFQGVGGSSGNTRTLGMKEARDVAAAFEYANRAKLKRPIVLYGVSMGSAAILRAIALERVQPDAVILELPFARLVDAVKSRFQFFKIPNFGLAELLVLWGSLQHGANGFAHNPVTFARQVDCPALVFQGRQDRWTTVAEVEGLVKNLRGPKELVVFPKADHQLLVTVDKSRWTRSVDSFLRQIENPALSPATPYRAGI
ncbi:alpha/beta hydrolase [Altericista sp. CCNU0014]|uniref:alpha/beta hydrolase n=1 Tax=Altericista sp. CCNU0014 TaxID=3082949 RepID=UPI00384F75D0